MSQHSEEILQGERFEFGKNWKNFLTTITPEKIEQSKQAMCDMLGIDTLVGKTFLDIGSGSGLSSLVARQLGAYVISFDYDKDSVNSTRALKNTFCKDDLNWTIKEGSALDAEFLKSLGQFDVVYSWGVLHHTGDMYQAFQNVLPTVVPGGQLFLAIYNDQGWISSYWKGLKSTYCKYPILRPFIKLWHLPYPLGASVILRLLTGRLKNLGRGMTLWHDYLDWLGGYPFEVASVDAVVNFFKRHGLEPIKVKATERSGCSEYVFLRQK